MKKATKKLLTLALSTLLVGAGLGGSIAAYNAYNAPVASAEETAAGKKHGLCVRFPRPVRC